MNTDFEVTLENVFLRLSGKPILKGCTLRVPRHQTTTLLGANGAGKTTLLRLCAGLLKAKDGRVVVCGENPARRKFSWQGRVAYVPDSPDAPPWMTLRDLLRCYKTHYPSFSDERSNELIEQLKAQDGTPFRQLSKGGGMKAMLIASLSIMPDLLLLDEPFGGLDPLARDELIRGVILATKEPRPTMLISTHDLDVATRIADHVALMSDGRITKVGPLDSVINPTTPQELKETLRECVEVGA